DKLNATVSKFRADGGALVFSTYIGGEDTDAGAGIAVDSAGNIYLAGATFSRDFPVTANAFQRMPGTTSREETATGDCFVLKLNAAGNALVYSTFLGGAAPDFCTSLALDSSGNVYVTGAAGSTGFPRTEDAFQTVLRSGYTSPPLDGFIAKVNPSGSALLYSTLFGGNGTDIATAIAIDAAGNAYVTGITNSTAGFPVTAAAFQSRYNQSGPLINPFMFDAFVLKMNPTGSAVVYSTYLGGAGNDQAYGIAVDSQGAAHICGSTDSTDFPVGAQAYQRSLLGSGGQAESSMGSGDGFVAKLNAAGTQLVFSTYLGGTRDDRATGCALDKDGGIHVTGHTLSANFPVSNDARQRTYGGTASHTVKTGDAFYSKLDPSGRALLYSTYFGGSDDDAGMGIAVDSAGAVYIAGATTSVNLPVSAAAAQRIYGGGPIATGPIFFGDAFLVKFGDAPTVVQPPPPPPPSIGSVVSAASAIGGAVAPGEIVNIGGVNLGPATAVIGQTRVLFDAIAAPVLSASGNLVMAIVPYGVAGKSATQIVVEYQGSRSSPLSVPVVATKPALFTTNGIGRGQAVAAHLDGTANSAENPIPANEIVTLQGTGAGLTEPDSVDGLVASEDWPPIAAAVSVKFGDIAAEEIFFAGGVKGKTAGYFQIQLRVPATVPAGTVPVIVTIGTAASQTGVTIVVAEPLQPSGANGRRTLGITRSPAVHIP
ncbi:MAG: SBBP repeat-containing protein, partial [Candidatus Solibacter usitatus]|nr:SBBP repeat-containing protein [Candidatus Solibacter usitatus]